jgi:hypothetical protein
MILEGLVREWAEARAEILRTEWDKTKVYDPAMVQRLATAEQSLVYWVRDNPKG